MSSIPANQPNSFDSMLKSLSLADQETAIERVGIMEFEGNITRKEAEQAVMSLYIKPTF